MRLWSEPNFWLKAETLKLTSKVVPWSKFLIQGAAPCTKETFCKAMINNLDTETMVVRAVTYHKKRSCVSWLLKSSRARMLNACKDWLSETKQFLQTFIPSAIKCSILVPLTNIKNHKTNLFKDFSRAALHRSLISLTIHELFEEHHDCTLAIVRQTTGLHFRIICCVV